MERRSFIWECNRFKGDNINEEYSNARSRVLNALIHRSIEFFQTTNGSSTSIPKGFHRNLRVDLKDYIEK